MSGGGSKKKPTRSQGWEEAGSEFYQESYPMDGESLEILTRDPKHLTTLLPSKQTRAAATIRIRTNDNRTNNRTMRRQTSSRSRRDSTVHRRASVAVDVQMSMLPDLSENLSNEQTTWEEIMLIKAMPVPMAEKKERKARILNEPNLRLQGYEQFKWKRRKVWRQMHSRLMEICEKLELWRSDLKHIEGRFGTGVVAYFLFIKWLVMLNLSIFLISFLFITLPTILVQDEITCSANETCCTNYFERNDSDNFIILDIVQGTGLLERTVLFYGFYRRRVISFLSPETGLWYNIPIAYVCVTIAFFLFSLIGIVRAAAKGFRERLVEGEGQFYQYCNLVFGGWDFCIHNEKSAVIKHRAIYNEVKLILETETREEERLSRTRNEYVKIVTFRVLANSCVLGILAACGCAIYYVFQESTKQLKQLETQNITTELQLEQLLFEFLPSLSIVCLNMIVPFIFRFLISFENYSPVFELRLTLFRTVVLRLASLIMLYTSLLAKITCDKPAKPNTCYNTSCNVPECWETYVGQQIYKLIITDFATNIVITFVVNFLRATLAKHIENKFFRLIGEQSFDLPKHVLDIVYSQTLVWFGLFYAPLLSALASIFFFLMFYIKKFTCLVNCKPSTTVYRASRSNSMFMLVLLVSYVFAILPIAYTMSELTPSRSCGPFRHLESVWNMVIEHLMLTPLWIQNIGFFLSTAGFVIPVLVLLLLLLYYYSAINSANRHMVVVLKNQLVLEGHDKQFLLNRLSMFLKQQSSQMRHESMRHDGDRNISSN